jgi:hypothetical protein
MSKSKYASIQIVAVKPNGFVPVVAAFPAQQQKTLQPAQPVRGKSSETQPVQIPKASIKSLVWQATRDTISDSWVRNPRQSAHPQKNGEPEGSPSIVKLDR